MKKSDPMLEKIEAFNEAQGGGVIIRYARGGYSLFLEEDGSPIARLRTSGDESRVEVLWWSHRGKWESIGEFGGVFLPLDEALDFVAEDPYGLGIHGFIFGDVVATAVRVDVSFVFHQPDKWRFENEAHDAVFEVLANLRRTQVERSRGRGSPGDRQCDAKVNGCEGYGSRGLGECTGWCDCPKNSPGDGSAR